jgi:hypothetical protein
LKDVFFSPPKLIEIKGSNLLQLGITLQMTAHALFLSHCSKMGFFKEDIPNIIPANFGSNWPCTLRVEHFLYIIGLSETRIVYGALVFVLSKCNEQIFLQRTL